MTTFKINGETVNTFGELPAVGSKAPDFLLTKTDLSNITLNELTGKKVILNIFPSVDTPICSASVRKFNAEISNYPNAVVLCASRDLPFAHSRFCEAEGLKGVIPVSELRTSGFGDTYGVRIAEGPLTGLFARAVIVVDESGTVLFSKIVEELTNEPDYEEVLDVLKSSDTGDNVCLQSATAEHSRSQDSNDPCDDGRAG